MKGAEFIKVYASLLMMAIVLSSGGSRIWDLQSSSKLQAWQVYIIYIFFSDQRYQLKTIRKNDTLNRFNKS